MGKENKTYAIIGAVTILTFAGIFVASDLSREKEEPTQVIKWEIKMPEIAPREATEAFEIEVVTEPNEVTVARLKKTTEKPTEETTGEVDEDGNGWVQLSYSGTYHITENHLTKRNGSIRFRDHWETWYSTNEPGQTVTAVDIPGKHVAEDGTIRDIDGYVCVASSDLPFYTILMTSVGPAKVYDTGCSRGIIDVYTTW